MLMKPMFVKRKKYTVKETAESRLVDRWDQQVFFITQKFPHAVAAISTIRKSHAAKLGSDFIPSEESLAELEELKSSFQA